MRRGLSKGVVQLLQQETPVSADSEAALNHISPNPYQPRRNFDDEALKELAESIVKRGVLQPILVRDLGGRYELVAGERRYRAAKLAKLKSIPIKVVDVDDRGMLEIALIENVQRQDISPVESARAFQRLQSEFSLTQEQVAERIGKSRVSVANTIRLLKLPTKILQALESGQVSEGHARALLQVEDEALQLALFQRIVEGKLTVRDVEAAARQLDQAPTKKQKSKPVVRDPEWRALESGIAGFFSSPVQLKRTEKGGQIVIDFYNDTDLDRILELLGIRL